MISPDPCHRPPVKERLKKLLLLLLQKRRNRVPALPNMASRAALVASAPGGRSDKRRDRTHPTGGLPPIPRTVPTQKPLPSACAQPCSLLAQVISRLFF